ncbi:GNAT family N-acetyltransferase [Candidatus Woesearchaeota archaeon]|nr:GNAT family N-acetyltransferase [Candidatus Woesearchaeota archaeon]
MAEFELERCEDGTSYWTLKDIWFTPYGSLTAEEVKDAPVPFYVCELHPDNALGFETGEADEFTNMLLLPGSFEELAARIDPDLRKDLRRVERKNAEVKIVFNRKEDFDVASRWFLERWSDETTDEFRRRRELWLENCYFISAYLGDELIAFHIAWDLGESIYYCGCWWNREYRSMSPAIFLLKNDIERAIKDGKKIYDLGVGDEPYKKDWRPKSIPTKYYAKMTPEQAKELDVDKFDLP